MLVTVMAIEIICYDAIGKWVVNSYCNEYSTHMWHRYAK